MTSVAQLYEMLRLLAVVLTVLAALSAAGAWVTGRIVERQRAAEALRLQGRVDSAEKEADRLRRRFASREISTEQRQRMLAALKGSQGTLLLVFPSDQEAKRYAQKIGEILASAGWQVHYEGGFSFGPVLGFDLQMQNAAQPASPARALRSALEAAFGAAEGSMRSQPNMKADELRLSIGVKPDQVD